MKHFAPVLLLVAATALPQRGLGAETTPPILTVAKPPAPANPIAPRASDQAERPRLISPGVANVLAAVSPKFTPTETKPAPAVPATEEKDQPRNGIVRLPNYIVEERGIPDFPERRMLTPRGRLDVAMKRFPGLHFNPLWFLGSNDGIALFMLEEERRLERMREMADLIDLIRITDPDAGAALKRETDKTFLRGTTGR